jgi:D-alanine--D-alanine ligase
VRRESGERDGVPVDRDSEFDSPGTIESIAAALRAAGHTVHPVEATAELPHWFLTHEVDLVFNIAEGEQGEYRESQVPAVLELLGIPFTGSGSVALALALDKAKTKQILASEGIPTPAWQLFATPRTVLSPRLRFPLIVKPNREGSSKGIWRESVVHDEAALRAQVGRVFERYRQEALVEEFIAGTELTAGVIGDEPLPVLEIDFSACREQFYTWRMKEFQGNEAMGLVPTFHCPARLDASASARVQAMALRAHRSLGCLDVSRTDIRLSRDGVPYVLEINPLPGLSPLDSNFPLMTSAAGLTHHALIQRIVGLSMSRFRTSSRIRERNVPPREPLRGYGFAQDGAAPRGRGQQEV